MIKKHRNFMLAIMFFVLVIGLFFLLYGVFHKNYITINYQEDNSVKYKVYLKENNYFEADFLGENRTYIANLIDYLDIDFQYLINFSENVTGNCNYYLKAVVSANKPNDDDGYYWQKEFRLTEPKKISVYDKKSFLIRENAQINYDKYNKILDGFKKEYSMQTDGELVVSLVVEGVASGDNYNEDIVIGSNVNLSIPLLEQTVEASIQTDASSVSKTLSMIDSSHSIFYFAFSCFGIILLIIDIVLFIIWIIYAIKNKKENLYETAINKIVNSHDSIIANVVKLPSLTGFKIINVSTFDELLDVYNEVRMPINFHKDESKKECVFLIINDSVAWRYVLYEKDFKRKKTRKKKK